MKFWCLLAMVASIAHITQQNSLIGSSSIIELFIGCNADIDISVPIQFLPTRFYHGHRLHIHTCHASHILWKNLQVYNIQDSVQQKEHQNKMHAHFLGIA